MSEQAPELIDYEDEDWGDEDEDLEIDDDVDPWDCS
jgi:hypothetical protein